MLELQEMEIQSLDQADLLEKEMATQLQYCCLGNPTDRGDWRVQSPGSQRVGHDRNTSMTHTATCKTASQQRAAASRRESSPALRDDLAHGMG